MQEHNTELDIIGTKWRLHATDEMPQDWMLGYMDAHRHTISLKRDVFDSWALYLLLHEVLHALTFMGHLQFLRDEGATGTQMDDEAKVDALASLMAHFITNNKGVIDKLTPEN